MTLESGKRKRTLRQTIQAAFLAAEALAFTPESTSRFDAADSRIAMDAGVLDIGSRKGEQTADTNIEHAPQPDADANTPTNSEKETSSTSDYCDDYGAYEYGSDYYADYGEAPSVGAHAPASEEPAATISNDGAYNRWEKLPKSQNIEDRR